MNLSSEHFPLDPLDPPRLAARAPRPFYWSVRRELWENRSIYLGPLIVAAVVLFSTLIATMSMPGKIRRLPAGDQAGRHAMLAKPFQVAPAPIMLTTFIVGVFYCFDALYGERRDRSILFWKSLPVSDGTTVLSKASIPFAVLPLIAWVLSVVVQVILLWMSTIMALANGLSPVLLWSEARPFQGLLIMFYGLTVHVLWFAPIYGWALLVSGWAKRAPFLWATLPLLAVSAVERIVFNSTRFLSMLQYRVTGAMTEAFVFKPKPVGDVDRLSQLVPGHFLTRPGLWVGLIFAAACLYAAVRVRRKREPI